MALGPMQFDDGNNIAVNEEITDFNNATESGFYHANAGASNSPSPTSYVNCIVIKGAVITTQIATVGNTTIYMRRKYQGSWTAWNKVTLSA